MDVCFVWKTERLLLRAMDAYDAVGYEELLTDPTAHPWISDVGPIRGDDVLEKIRRNREAFAEGRALFWSAEMGGEFVGFVALHRWSHPEVFVSYAIRKAWRRRGLCAEMVSGVLGWIQRDCPQVRCVVVETHLANDASMRVARAAGFVDQGCLSTKRGMRRVFRFWVG